MIAKKRTIPLEILIFNAVLRRLPERHPRKAEFENKLIRWRAGYKGERELDYHISQFSEDDHTIIQNIRLPHNDTHFQIDTLIITPSFLLNLEAKNYAGEIEIHPDFDQLIQTKDGIQKGYYNPILQAKTQSSHLNSWLLAHNFPLAPIEYFVTISSPQTIIRNPTASKEVANRVCRTSRIPYKIMELKTKYKTEIFSKKEIKKAVRLLLKSHEPLVPDIDSMNLPVNDLITGVQCPKCFAFGMQRTHGTWYCKTCSHTSKTEHIPAIKDYFLLYGFTLTNKQLRDFLHVSSADFVTRILNTLNLLTMGCTKNKTYLPPHDFFN